MNENLAVKKHNLRKHESTSHKTPVRIWCPELDAVTPPEFSDIKMFYRSTLRCTVGKGKTARFDPRSSGISVLFTRPDRPEFNTRHRQVVIKWPDPNQWLVRTEKTGSQHPGDTQLFENKMGFLHDFSLKNDRIGKIFSDRKYNCIRNKVCDLSA